MAKEVVVISGKGGTGKTSLTASFAALASDVVLADCDVDAADLHLVLAPEERERHAFWSGHEARIRQEDCRSCGRCFDLCRYGAIIDTAEGEGTTRYTVDPIACEGCGVCVWNCPEQAIDFPERLCGEWMVSDTRWGPMVHARLHAAAENSGKLVSLVRAQARKLANENGCPTVLVDGPPGTGCPVIASLTGAVHAVVVTEPTVSGAHDLERVLALARHFEIPATVCVNKWDLNPEMAGRIEEAAFHGGAYLGGRIRYDPGVTRAQLEARAVVETDAPSAEDIRAVWQRLGFGWTAPAQR